jgi:hypothetical protein
MKLTQLSLIELCNQKIINFFVENPNQDKTRRKENEPKKTQQREGKQWPELELSHVSPLNVLRF